MALTINGETIDEEVIDQEFRHIKGHFERTLQVACCERDPEFRNMAKDNIISRALLQQEARKRFPEISDEDIQTRLAMLIEQAGGEDQFYANIGLPVKDESLVRDNVAGGVRLDKMLNSVYAPEPEPDEAAMHAYYDEHVSLFLTEEEIQVSHISLNLNGAQSRVEVYNKMRGLRTQALEAPAKFEAIAQENNSSTDQSPDLGWFKRGEFMEEFEAIAFSMSVGEISPVFTTQLGFHICKLTDRKVPEPKPFGDVVEIVRTRILESYRDEKFNQFIEELKGLAKLEDSDPEESDSTVVSHH